MKRALISALFGLSLLLGPTGCDKPNSVLPPEVAGTWKAEKTPWEITLTPNGEVASAVIFMGGVKIKPNQTTKKQMLDGQYSTWKAGPCEVSYNPENRKLFVNILIEHMVGKMGDFTLEGFTDDFFTGPVSEDGKTWNANWINRFDYGERFPMDPNFINEPQIFKKVD